MTVALCTRCDGAGVELDGELVLVCEACHGARLVVDVHHSARRPLPSARPMRRAS